MRAIWRIFNTTICLFFFNHGANQDLYIIAPSIKGAVQGTYLHPS